MAAPRGAALLAVLLVACAGVGGAKSWLGGLSRASFPKGFVFGTATSAYQVEGAAASGGRGPSIWDAFAHTPGNRAGNQNGDVAVDQYHRYKEDVNLMKGLNFDAYRFSISWSRIFPDVEGRVNPEGVAYYNNLINYLLQKGITPYVNLYHFDLPLALEKKYGGWLNAKMVDLFSDYSDFCFKTFGDRVKHWFTFNEPRGVTLAGYDVGSNPPQRCTKCAAGGNSATEPYIVAHNYLVTCCCSCKIPHQVSVLCHSLRRRKEYNLGITKDKLTRGQTRSRDKQTILAGQMKQQTTASKPNNKNRGQPVRKNT